MSQWLNWEGSQQLHTYTISPPLWYWYIVSTIPTGSLPPAPAPQPPGQAAVEVVC